MTSNAFKKLSYTLFAFLVIFVLATFKQYGISNDELVQHTYGQLLVKFYVSGFADQSAFTYKNLYLYGGFFDLVAASLEKVLPLWVAMLTLQALPYASALACQIISTKGQ